MAQEVSLRDTGLSRQGLSISRLAVADMLHEWRLFVCNVLAVTVILAPLLLLFGLKHGLVYGLREQLVSDPANLEIKHFGEDGFGRDWFRDVAALPWVAFVVPRTRFSHTALMLRNPDDLDAEPLEVSLIPSGDGDPVLARASAAIPVDEQVVLTEAAAEALRVGVGARLEAMVSRSSGDLEREHVRLDLDVTAVVPRAVTGDAMAYVALPILVAVEDYREWQAVPRYDWAGNPPVDDPFASFRLYARTIDDVEPLRQWLRDRHLTVETAADRIATVRRLDRNLGVLFNVLLALAVVGFVLSLALNLLANVARKRRELAVLRLSGFTTAELVRFPLVQALSIGGAGSLLALLVFLAVQPIIDSLFADSLDVGERLTRLEPYHAVIAVAASLVLAAISATAAGWRAARAQPSENLRNV